MNAKSVEEYLQQPYTIEVFRDTNPENPGWVARVVELPGVITQADTFEELEAMIQDAMRGWIKVALEDGDDIPEPRPEEDYSGKFIVRVPKSLHRRLAKTAEREGTSLNQFVSTVLAGAVAPAAPTAPPVSPQEIRAWITEAVLESDRDHWDNVFDKVLDFADSAVDSDPGNPLPHLTRAKTLLKKNDFQAALDAAEKGLELAGKDQPGSVREGQGYYRPFSFYSFDRKEPDAAQSRPDSDPRPELFLVRVDALTGLGRMEEVLETLQEAVALYPGEIIFYRYMAALLLKMGKPQEALSPFKAARKARVPLDQPSKQLEKKIKAILAQEK